MDTYAAGTDITSGKVVIQLAKDESWNMYTGAWEEAQNVNVLADQKVRKIERQGFVKTYNLTPTPAVSLCENHRP